MDVHVQASACVDVHVQANANAQGFREMIAGGKQEGIENVNCNPSVAESGPKISGDQARAWNTACLNTEG